MSLTTEKKFKTLIRAIARLIRTEVEQFLVSKKPKGKKKSKVDSSDWVSAFVDIRWYSDAEGCISKFRLVKPDQKWGSIRSSEEIDDLEFKISELRKTDQKKDWYGLRVIIHKEGETTTEIDNNPKCVLDPTWFYT